VPSQAGGNIFQPMDLGYELAKLTEQAEKRTRGSGILGSVGDTAAELFINKGIPYLAKKGTEARRYYASEFMRNPKLQKKAIDWGIKKATRVSQKVGSEVINQLSTKVRPNYKYKTDRMDLDADMNKGSGVPLPFPYVDWKGAKKVLTDPTLFKRPEPSAKERHAEYMRQYKEYKKKGGKKEFR